MQLTEGERAALERWLAQTYIKDEGRILGQQARMYDARTLADSMLCLFPVRTYGDIVIRWDDEITPERLVACGFNTDGNGTYPGPCYRGMVYQNGFLNPWLHLGVLVVSPFAPRNMGEVWQLMERCGIENNTK